MHAYALLPFGCAQVTCAHYESLFCGFCQLQQLHWMREQGYDYEAFLHSVSVD